MQIILPDSVFLYCTDSRVRSAVDLLLSSKSPKVPDGLGWNELEDFYSACLASQQTRIEWAISLNRIWNTVFLDRIAGWRPSTITEQVAEGVPVDIGSIWSDDGFTRDLVRGDFCLEAQLEMDADEGIRANIALYDGRTQLLLAVPKGMANIEGWVCSAWTPFGASPEFDLTKMRAQIREALQIADARASPISK